MIVINPLDKTIYYVLRSSDFSTIHFGSVEVGQNLSSGQQVLEEYYTKEDLILRLTELNVEFDKDSI